MNAARPAIRIRKTPSMEAANRAVAVAFSRGPVSIRSLRHAYAVLAVVSDLARWGRLPATWNTRRRPFARGHTLHNVEVALERVTALLEPLDFDVDFALPTAQETGHGA